jgi:hypothetical protein
MASSTQFSIRGLMILTVAAALVASLVGPRIRHLGPEEQVRAGVSFLLLGVVIGEVLGASCLKRRWVERNAGPLIARTALGGEWRRWSVLIFAIGLSAATAYGTVFLASYVASAYCFGAMVLVGGFSTTASLFPSKKLRSKNLLLLGAVFGIASSISIGIHADNSVVVAASFFVIALGILAADLFLRLWWGTGPYATEAFQNGLVVWGQVLKPWPDLVLYEPSLDSGTVLIVNESTETGLRPFRIRVAAEDRADWERILCENGVSRVGGEG